MTNHQRATAHPTDSGGLESHADATEFAQITGHSLVFLTPDRLVSPPSWIEHIPFAFWLMDVLRPEVFVELGTHSGNSYAAFAQAATHLGLNAAGYAIDTWKGDEQAGFYDESVYTDWRAYHDLRYSSFSRLVRSTFDQAAEHFADRSVDLLHIDGYHTAESVDHDFQTWRPKMSARAIVLLHDINVREGNFGAWKIWEELRGAYPSFEFLHGHGLGVLAVGNDLPSEVAWLTSLAPSTSPSVVRVRDFFARMGASVLMRYNIADTTAAAARERSSAEIALAEAQAQSADMNQRLLEAESRAQQTQEQLLAFQAQVAELSAQMRAQEAQASESNQRLADVETVANQTQQQLAAREVAVTELSAELSSRRRAAAIQQSLSQASAQSLAAASARTEALRQRLRVTANLASQSERSTSTPVSRVIGTLRALGATPRAIVRRPRSIGTLLRLALDPRRVRDAHLVAQSGLFDAAHYMAHAPDVAANGVNPLAHFVLSGGAQGRSPHPLFDSSWYLAHYPDVKASGVNPLAHYLRTAPTEARDPHALFSTAYYRAHTPQATTLGLAPLQHYVRHGVLEGRSPHPLFDPEYYIDTYGRVLTQVDPLVHFLEAGAASDFNPHPLFDTRYYRKQVRGPWDPAVNPLLHYLESDNRHQAPHPLFDPAFYSRSNKDVSASGVEPLTHFVMTGGAEGRRPGRDFDGAWYLGTYGDVASSGANPLVHYVRFGWSEWRNPSPHFDTAGYLGRYPDVATTGVNPLVHYVEHGRSEGRIAAPTDVELGPGLHLDAPVGLRSSNLNGSTRVARAVVCLTHVTPVNPRAGNEYRIHRMLRWLHDSGYTVIPVVAPTDGIARTDDDVRAIANEFGNAIICPPDGRLKYVLRDVPDVLQSLDGESPHAWSAILREDRFTSKEDRALLAIDRAFCSDALITTVLRLQSALGPHVLLAEYIWMSRLLPLAGRNALRIIDTHDVFSSREEKVGQFGIKELTLSPDAERLRVSRADLVIAIQVNERTELERLGSGIPVVTTGVDFSLIEDGGAPAGHRILYVASGNAINRRGLKDFLRFAWPRIQARVPQAELVVVGAVGDILAVVPPGVTRMGLVEHLGPLYQACKVVINPAVAGTGLKIKTLEALTHLRPIVTWPNGVEGLSANLARLCLTAHDWYSFANLVTDTLRDDRSDWFSASDREILKREGSPLHVYAELGVAIEDFFAHAAQTPGDADANARGQA